jgi:hypothetical protein
LCSVFENLLGHSNSAVWPIDPAHSIVGDHVGKSPLELLSALSGHPVPHDTVFLDIMDVQTRKVVEYVVRKDVVSSFTRILKWSE